MSIGRIRVVEIPPGVVMGKDTAQWSCITPLKKGQRACLLPGGENSYSLAAKGATAGSLFSE